MTDETTHCLLHRLWTQVVGTPDYDKQLWKELESRLLALEKENARLMSERAGKIVLDLTDDKMAIKLVGETKLHWLPPPYQGTPDLPANSEELVALVKRALIAERERCAKHLETCADALDQHSAAANADGLRHVAAALRAGVS